MHFAISNRKDPVYHSRHRNLSYFRRLRLEPLESRWLLNGSYDLGDPPEPYLTTWVEETAQTPDSGSNLDAPEAESADELLQFTAGGHVLGFASDGVYVGTGSHALHVEFVGAQDVSPQAEGAGEAQQGKAAELTHVSYVGLWDGITLNYDAAAGGISESTYVLDPRADPGQIGLQYNVPVEIDEAGDLVMSFETGQMKESAPVAWQDIDGRRLAVDVSFVRTGDRQIGFALGEYDSAFNLTIDPTLTWNTFLGAGGGSGSDYGQAIAVDGSGSVYVGGWSGATWGSPVRAHTGKSDAFAAKFASDGTLVWNTFLGGSGSDRANAIAVDGSGNVYVGGRSYATWGSPVRAYTSDRDAFAAKLASNGTLVWNTFRGGSEDDSGTAIAVDGSGNVYVAGYSEAVWGSPVSAYAGKQDAFAVKLANDGTLIWHDFLGSSGRDYGSAIAVDGSGNVYVGGKSEANWGSPVRDYTAGDDAFAAKLASNGSLVWNTFLGGGFGPDSCNAIAVDGSGNVYVAGGSASTWGSPVRDHSGYYDVFAAKLTSDGTLTWNTFLGSRAQDYGYAIAVDGSGNVYVGGASKGTWGSPVRAHTGSYDAFAAKLASDGSLVWNTFLGGRSGDYGRAISVDGSGNVYVGGISYSVWGSPVSIYTSGGDAFAAKLSNDGTLVWNTYQGVGSGSDNGYAIAVDGSGNVYVAGYSSSTWGSPVRGYTSDSDAFAAKLATDGTLVWNTFLGGSGSDLANAIAVDDRGNVYVGGRSYATWGSPVRAYTSGSDAFAAKLASDGTFVWNTFLGDSGYDCGNAIAVDGSGIVYVGGGSSATWGSSRRCQEILSVWGVGWSCATSGSLVGSHAGRNDAFAAKLADDGSLIWNTFLGGSGHDYGNAIAVDGSGNVYVGGTSEATWGSPVRAYTGSRDAFVAKLANDGSLIWNTFWGGSGYDYGNAIAVDGSGNVYVGGTSEAAWGSPVRDHTSDYDAFAARLATDGTLVWNTFLGGGETDYGHTIAVDGSGSAYVGGWSEATWGLPVGARTGNYDAFAAKLANNGSLSWNIFLGGRDSDYSYAMAVDGNGNVYVAGHSYATWGSPVRAYAEDYYDAFAAKLSPAPDKLGLYSNGRFYLDTNGNGSWDQVSGGDTFRDFGISSIRDTATPVIGDWNGDGTDDLGLFDDGNFYLDANGNGVWDQVAGGDTFHDFGISAIRDTATPVIGNWNGDGTDDLGLYSGGKFYLDTNGNGVWDQVAGGDTFRDFGISSIRDSAEPVIGDWNNDGTDDLGLHNEGRFYLDTNGNGAWDQVTGGDTFRDFGISSIRDTAMPVIGDWEDHGPDGLGLYNDGDFYLDTTGHGVCDEFAGNDTFCDFGINSIRDSAMPVIGRWASASPLLAAGGQATVSNGAEELTSDALMPIVDQATAAWAASGLGQAELQRLANVQVRIADLAGAQLGEALGTTMTLDIDAAGYGWYVGPELRDEGQEPADSDAASSSRLSTLDPRLRMDLLTAVMHELGHVLGHGDQYDDLFSNDVMNGWLPVGVQRT